MSTKPVPKPRGAAATRYILQITLDMLGERGYSALTIEAVAERARASKATIYRRWANKSELVCAAASLGIHPVSVPDLGNFTLEVEFLLQSRLRQFADEGRRRMFVSLAAAAFDDDALADAFRRWVNESQAIAVREIVARASQRGDLRSDICEGDIVSMIGAPIVLRAIVERRPLNLEFADGIVRALTGGLLVHG